MTSRSSAPHRIAITGLGMVTSHADTVAGSWKAMLRGQRSARRLSAAELGLTDDDPASSEIIWSGAPAVGIDRHPAASGRCDPVIQLARKVAQQALRQARLSDTAFDPDRIGCVFGTSKGGLDAYQFLRSQPTGETSVDDTRFWSNVPPSAAAAQLSADHGWHGPNLAPVAACATGLVCLIRAAALIRDGRCDAVLTGSSDASLQPALLASFRRLGVLAPTRVDPATACRPFDRRRHGFVAGEGAGALVLERWEHAKARGVPILAEWVDGLQRADPHGLTVLPTDPEALVRLLWDLLRRADLSAAEVDAVSLHGTGTEMNDRYEAAAIRGLPGVDLERLRGFGLKGGIGHLLGAAGSVETVASVCSLIDQQLPPTVNCDDVAPDCSLPLTGQVAEGARLTHMVKISLGFGGHLAAGLLRRASGAMLLPVSAKSV